MTDESTPTLAKLLRSAINSYLVDLHTALPAQVVSYDREKQTARVKPCLRRTLVDGTEVELPDIYSVPVHFPSSGDAHIHFDLKKDDYVLLIFSERSIDSWTQRGGCVTPKERRFHNINDAFAIPGVKPVPAAFTPKGSPGSLTVVNKNSYFELKEDGKVVLNNGTEELMAILVELLTEMIAGKNLTGVGPLAKDPAYIAKLIEIKTKLETFKE